MEDVEGFAYGVLHFTPEQLGRMLPKQLIAAAKGHLDQQKTVQKQLAWMTANLVNMIAAPKDPITIEQVLGEEEKVEGEPPREETLAESHERILKRFEGVKL